MTVILDGILEQADTLNIPQFVGDVYYVDAGQSGDAGSGLTPDEAKQTIGAALSACSAGDAITIKAGTYTETGLDVNKNSVELWPEIGTIIAPASGAGLTISGSYCKIWMPGGSLRINPAANQTGLAVSGGFCYISDVRVWCNSSADIGFDITGSGAVLENCRSANPLVAAFKVQGDKVRLKGCCTGGEVADTSIGFWLTNSCDKARIDDCGSQGHATAGFQVDAGCTNVMMRKCASGGGDGHFVDNGTLTFLDVQDGDSRERHEHTYPTPNGEGGTGAAVTVQSEVNDKTGADSTMNYFGDPASIIPPATITTDWFLKGINIFATTADDDQRFRGYRVVYAVSATRNAGNAWDEGATVLTVQDATEAAQFAANDLVWITTPGHKPHGEIVKITDVTGAVITIARQTENSGRTGIHYDHSTNDAGNEVMYLCWRDERQYHSSDWDYSAQASRSFSSYRFAEGRRLHANDGLVVRMINGTDAANSTADITAIWSD